MSSELEAASQAPAEEGADSTAGPHAAHPFTLDITFSGLVLLVPEKGTGKLLVLLPDARDGGAHAVPRDSGVEQAEDHRGHGDAGEGEHGECAHADQHEMPPHVAVIGAHERYMPAGGTTIGHFNELILDKGTLVFEPGTAASTGTAMPWTRKISEFQVVNLKRAARGKQLDPTRALVRLQLGGGSVCVDCAHDDGANWNFYGKEQKMATRLTWRVEGLTTTVDGRPGITICLEQDGVNQKCFQILAIPDPGCSTPGTSGLRAALYLYNTPETERPSYSGHPPQPPKDEPLNHHFRAYYDLFIPALNEKLPRHVPHNAANDHPDEPMAVPTEQWESFLDLLDPSGLEHKKRAQLKRQSRFHGRLYTCAVATLEDEEHAAQASQRIDAARDAAENEGEGR